MKKYGIVLMILCLACEGRLSDEQRKKMKEQMELHKIKRVTESEITAAAFDKGRAIMKQVESLNSDSAKIDSLVRQHHGKVRWIVPGKSNAVALEQQLIDAYIASDSGAVQDNVQKLRNPTGDSDSIL